jgi:hypothetical protein
LIFVRDKENKKGKNYRINLFIIFCFDIVCFSNMTHILVYRSIKKNYYGTC